MKSELYRKLNVPISFQLDAIYTWAPAFNANLCKDGTLLDICSGATSHLRTSTLPHIHDWKFRIRPNN